MARVAQKLRQREQLGDVGSVDTALFPATNEPSNAQDQLQMLSTQWSINSAEIVHSTRPTFAPLIIRFQRFVRRATWWYLNPVVDQIIGFNGNVVRVLTSLHGRQEAMESALEQTSEKLELVARKIIESAHEDQPSVAATAGLSAGSENGVGTRAGGDSGSTAELREIREALAALAKRLDALEAKGHDRSRG